MLASGGPGDGQLGGGVGGGLGGGMGNGQINSNPGMLPPNNNVNMMGGSAFSNS